MIQNLQAFPSLSKNEINIWLAYLPDNLRDISHFVSTLSEDEYKKAYSFKFSKDQQYFIMARGVLRCLLGKYLKTIPKNIEIVYGPWGKPYVSAKQFLHFNLSHSRDYVLYAFTRSYEVGIDLEYINATFDVDSVVMNILCSEEFNYWNNINQSDKIKTFFKIWVCKEAFLKASGQGWTCHLPSLFNNLGDYDEAINRNLKGKNMLFPHCLDAIPHYASAFFINGPFLYPSYHMVHSAKFLASA